ncbi:MAG: response regulator, partial [Polaromonas sp.]
QPAHVLYVDDYEPMRLLVSEMLQDAGCEVSCYRRPQDALAAVQADPQGFDLVATDQYMPEMSGINFALALKNIRPGLPVAIISGYVDEDLKRRALEAGARLVLKKSDSLDMLCEELLQLLEAA